MRTEDQVRDAAKIILGFDVEETNILQGTGQNTSFKTLGFNKGTSNKPDGWYLPEKKHQVAIILETKAEEKDLSQQKFVDELLRNVQIARSKYDKVVGILYNGSDVRVFKNKEEVTTLNATLQPKSFYLNLFSAQIEIDKQLIYNLTKQINDCLHFQFGLKNLNHRMIFTACALVARRYAAPLHKGMSFRVLKTAIVDTLKIEIEKDLQKNLKLNLLIETYEKIDVNNENNQIAIDNFIDWVNQISDCVNSSEWRGEDVMGIFFNEFNRYKKKSESGQIFTPDHITSFMYRLIDIHASDRILDATCGSGAFLVKAMCNMINEVGINTREARQIQREQLFGIEFDKDVFALACANMLIHKDGKTNLLLEDSRLPKACEWIQSKNISKVLMNPPYERKYGCMTIVENVLNSVPVGTQCAFILPDKKLEKDKGAKLLKKHRLTTIVKMPENLFLGVGVTTSIFVFEAGRPQNNKDIIGYYIEEDGLETVKNQGRQDIKNRWQEKEDYWIHAIETGVEDKYNTRQIIHPSEHLSYQMPEKPFEIFEEDFIKTMMDYEMFKRGIDIKEFNDKLLNKVLYSSNISETECATNIVIEK
ncbi:MAG: class I SAM-dependent DNA methyltransferase [Paludibacteraceae bacterium]